MIPFQSLYFDDPMVVGRVMDIFGTASSRKIALFFVHGGSWKAGSRTVFHQIAQAYRELGFTCACTDYRLTDANVFTQIGDVQDSLKLFAQYLSQQGQPTRIALIGSSAGAHLALMAALQKPTAQEYDIAAVCVQSAPLTFEPWPDIFPGIWTAMQNAMGESYEMNSALYSAASPLRHISDQMPPIFIMHAENEHMFPISLTEQFEKEAAEKQKQINFKTYPATEHGFFYSLDRWQQKEAFNDILQFVEQCA